MAVTARELIFKIVGDSEKFNKAVEDSTKRLEDFKKKTKDANELFGKVAKMSAVATTAIAGLGIAALKLAKDFNEGFGAVQTLIPGATDRIKELQKNVLDLSPLVGKSTQDLTSGLYEVISAFGDSADSAKNLELAAKGATAGGATTKDSIALLSAVTKAYGDTSNVAQKKVSDLAFTTVKLGQTNFPELAASIQRVTSQSKTLGVTQEELFAVFSSGTGVIGGAAEVSTKFSAVLTEMQKPGDRLAKTFKALGVESGSELIEKFGGLQGALQALKAQADLAGEPISNLFGSAEAGKLALYAAGQGAEKFANDLEAMNSAIGATDQAFKDATIEGPNAFGFKLHQAGLNAKAFAIKVGQELIPSVQSLLTPVFKLAEGLKNLNEDQIRLITSIGKVLLAVTGITAGLFTLGKSVLAVKKAMLVLDGAFKAIGLTNPFVLAIAGAAAAVIAIKELCAWLDRAAEKQYKMRLAAMDENTARMKQAQNIAELAKQYATLNAKQKLTNQESVRMHEIAKQIAEITNQPVGRIDDLTGKTIASTDEFISGAKKVAKIKQEDLEHNKIVLEKLKAAQQQLSEQVKEYGESSGAAFQETLENVAFWLPKSVKSVTSAKDGLSKVSEEVKRLTEDIKETERGIAALNDFSKIDFTPEKEIEQKPVNAGNKAAGDDGKTKTQANRLKELDDLYNLELQLLEKQNLSASEKLKEKEELENKHYEKRLELLKTFHKENVTQNLKENNEQNLTLEQSLAKAVGKAQESILEETKNTNAELSRLAEERHRKEIEEINKTVEETKKAVEAEIALKKQTGQIEGNNDYERKQNEHLAKAQMYLEKRNELTDKYLKLAESSNEKDKEKAEAFKTQIKELGEKAQQEANAAESAFERMAKKVAGKIASIGSQIADIFSQIADVAKSIINNQEEERAQAKNKRLAEIERARNEEILGIDNELAEHREQKQIEDAEREEQRRQAEYDKKLGEYNRSIQELKGQMETETNIERYKQQEKQLEAEQKKKAEELKRKKEEDEKRKRDKEARAYEITLLNARSQAEHEFAVARIQTENQAGVASAQAAQQAAKWQKAQAVLSLTVKGAEQTALAAVAIARALGGDPSGAAEAPARIAAAAIAFTQAGVAGSQPLPPDYIVQPIPAPPRPIKFASGGIVMPTAGGTQFNLPSGYPAIAGEAGAPELILPINAPNLETMFKAAGVTNTDNSKSLSYNPSYHIEISQNQDQDLPEMIMGVLKDKDRDVLNVVNGANQNYMVGDKN